MVVLGILAIRLFHTALRAADFTGAKMSGSINRSKVPFIEILKLSEAARTLNKGKKTSKKFTKISGFDRVKHLPEVGIAGNPANAIQRLHITQLIRFFDAIPVKLKQ